VIIIQLGLNSSAEAGKKFVRKNESAKCKQGQFSHTHFQSRLNKSGLGVVCFPSFPVLFTLSGPEWIISFSGQRVRYNKK
jgi:hypothetical protein